MMFSMTENSCLSSPFSVLLVDVPDVDVDMFSTNCAASVEGGGCASPLGRRSWFWAAACRRPLDAEVIFAGSSSRTARHARKNEGGGRVPASCSWSGRHAAAVGSSCRCRDGGVFGRLSLHGARTNANPRDFVCAINLPSSYSSPLRFGMQESLKPPQNTLFRPFLLIYLVVVSKKTLGGILHTQES